MPFGSKACLRLRWYRLKHRLGPRIGSEPTQRTAPMTVAALSMSRMLNEPTADYGASPSAWRRLHIIPVTLYHAAIVLPAAFAGPRRVRMPYTSASASSPPTLPGKITTGRPG